MPEQSGFFNMNLSNSDQKAIIAAIKTAELQTTGEIKVHIEAKCLNSNPYLRSQEVFDILALDKTAQRNGVLFYWAYEDRKMAIIGDSGINKVVGDDFWKSTLAILHQHFGKGAYAEGLIKAIHEAGDKLSKHFPIQAINKQNNEISDEISFGNN